MRFLFSTNRNSLDIFRVSYMTIRTYDSGIIVRWDDDADLEQALDILIDGNTSRTKRPQLDVWLSDHTREKMAANILDRINGCL
jgi:hypothetical protein